MLLREYKHNSFQNLITLNDLSQRNWWPSQEWNLSSQLLFLFLKVIPLSFCIPLIHTLNIVEMEKCFSISSARRYHCICCISEFVFLNVYFG